MTDAWSTACTLGEDQLDIVQVDFVVARNADGPIRTPRAQSLAERCRQAIADIGQHAAEPYACRYQPVDFLNRNLGLAPGGLIFLGHARPGHAHRISDPVVRQEQPQAYHDRHFVRRQG